MNVYDFDTALRVSQGVVAATAQQTIIDMLPYCVSVEKANTVDDKSGIDYWATLDSGVRIGIDHKSRNAGCRCYWKQGPELALEMWSVMPSSMCLEKIGWTLDRAKQTDYILHTFNIADSDQAYLLPFQLLRACFVRKGPEWQFEFKTDVQMSVRGMNSWCSQCVFVPASVVIQELLKCMINDGSISNAN